MATEFAQFGLRDDVLRALEEMGFVEPTPIQEGVTHKPRPQRMTSHRFGNTRAL